MADPLFTNDDSTQNPPVTPNTSSDPYADLLKSIKNEDGTQKYDSVQKALDALNHSQNYIPQIKSQLTEKEQELERVKAELAKHESIEEVIQRLAQTRATTEGDPPAASGLDEQAVRNLLKNELQLTAAQANAQANSQKVESALLNKFGEKAKEVIAEKAKELNTTPADLGALASKSPEMVLALFNVTNHNMTSPTRGSVNIPPINKQTNELPKPTKSLLAGATGKEQRDYMRQVRESVYAEHGITN